MAQLGDLVQRRLCCGAPGAPLGRSRPWPERAASSPRPRSRSSRATSAGPRSCSTRRAALEATGTERTPRMPWSSRSVASRSAASTRPSTRSPGSNRHLSLRVEGRLPAGVRGDAMRRLRTKAARALARAERKRARRASCARGGGECNPGAPLSAARGSPAARSGFSGSRRSKRCWGRGAGRGRTPSRRAQRAQHLARKTSGVVRAGARLGEAWPESSAGSARLGRACRSLASRACA